MADADQRSTIRPGRNFEDTFRLDAAAAGEVLIALGERLRDDDEVTILGDDWELPFAFGEPVQLEVEYEGVDDPELEIEIELPGRTDERSLEIR
ncbi:amphi-Trp domain-containing protein [Halopenitus sp. POP-27]|uniref:amphi-Trp domain-containing protein n=1 Tax=Halopenitus sp. POP-27 TaxID=2994425 RepID=UPI002468A790|nr:amphi-Trp domain-containing protein [Halopenitus sp. POP-27]